MWNCLIIFIVAVCGTRSIASKDLQEFSGGGEEIDFSEIFKNLTSRKTNISSKYDEALGSLTSIENTKTYNYFGSSFNRDIFRKVRLINVDTIIREQLSEIEILLSDIDDLRERTNDLYYKKLSKLYKNVKSLRKSFDALQIKSLQLHSNNDYDSESKSTTESTTSTTSRWWRSFGHSSTTPWSWTWSRYTTTSPWLWTWSPYTTSRTTTYKMPTFSFHDDTLDNWNTYNQDDDSYTSYNYNRSSTTTIVVLVVIGGFVLKVGCWLMVYRCRRKRSRVIVRCPPPDMEAAARSRPAHTNGQRPFFLVVDVNEVSANRPGLGVEPSTPPPDISPPSYEACVGDSLTPRVEQAPPPYSEVASTSEPAPKTTSQNDQIPLLDTIQDIA